jgi:hypothetical protein
MESILACGFLNKFSTASCIWPYNCTYRGSFHSDLRNFYDVLVILVLEWSKRSRGWSIDQSVDAWAALMGNSELILVVIGANFGYDWSWF